MNANEERQLLRMVRLILTWAGLAIPFVTAIGGGVWYVSNHVTAFAMHVDQASGIESDVAALTSAQAAHEREHAESMASIERELSQIRILLEQRLGPLEAREQERARARARARGKWNGNDDP